MGQPSDTSKLLGEVISLGVELQGVETLHKAMDLRMATIRQLMVNIIDREDMPEPVDEGP